MSKLKDFLIKTLKEKKENVPNFSKVYNDVNNYSAIPLNKKKDHILLFVQNEKVWVQLLLHKKDLPPLFCSRVFNYPWERQYILFPKTFDEIKKEIKNIKEEKNKIYFVKILNDLINFHNFPEELNIEITLDKDWLFEISGLFDINKWFVVWKDNFLKSFNEKVYKNMIDKINKRLLENKEINFILDN